MGNKSKRREVKGKWHEVRKLVDARMPPSRSSGWSGLQEKAISPKVDGVRLKLPVLYASANKPPLRGSIKRVA